MATNGSGEYSYLPIGTSEYYDRVARRKHPEIKDEWVEQVLRDHTTLKHRQTAELDTMDTSPKRGSGLG